MNSISFAKQKQAKEKLTSLYKASEEKEIKEKAKHLNLSYLNLARLALDPQIISLIDETQARQAQSAVIGRIGRKIHLAMLNPSSIESKELIKNLEKKGFFINIFLVSNTSLKKAWQKYENAIIATPSQKNKTIIDAKKIHSSLEQIKNLSSLQGKIQDVSVTDLINIILAGAIKLKASDIHIEPREQGADTVRIRYRLDGVLHDIAFLSKKTYKPIISRFKLLSGLQINTMDTPQNGRFTIEFDSIAIDVRTSTLPGPAGETMSLRILDSRSISLSLQELGLQEHDTKKVKQALEKTTGMLLVTGPTGSGKTTTLYTFLQNVSTPGIKIITLEDPIEYKLEGITQTQINEKQGYTFEIGLKNTLRQDPDVILLGEIRDKHAGRTALDAALTGHRVFSTLHTNNAWGAIPRLIRMGIPEFVIAPAINLIIAQRLVRKICKTCQAKGCSKCNNTGYYGRIGIFEMFVIDDQMEKLILSSPSSIQVKELAIKQGMSTMHEDGLLKVKQGLTTIDEVKRVTGE